MSDLERRYLRLVRLFYPAGYRHERGTEIVGTYLALAAPERRWPSAADLADLAGGGVRQRLRAAGATGLGPGSRLAGTLALLTATALAGAWLILELNPRPEGYGVRGFGDYVSLSVAVWATWLIAAVVHAVAPGRWTRVAVSVALAVTVAVVPLAVALDTYRPPLFVLLPQITLGLVALGAPDRAPLWQRLLPLAATPAALPLLAFLRADGTRGILGYWGWTTGELLSTVGVLLLLGTMLLAVGLALRGDFRGAWALLILLGPIGMLSIWPLAGSLADYLYDGWGPDPDFPTMAAVAVAVTLVAAAAVPLALTARDRIRRQ